VIAGKVWHLLGEICLTNFLMLDEEKIKRLLEMLHREFDLALREQWLCEQARTPERPSCPLDSIHDAAHQQGMVQRYLDMGSPDDVYPVHDDYSFLFKGGEPNSLQKSQ
jgi:hypothetical protein